MNSRKFYSAHAASRSRQSNQQERCENSCKTGIAVKIIQHRF